MTANQLRDDDYGFSDTISRKDIVQAAGYYEFRTECVRCHLSTYSCGYSCG